MSLYGYLQISTGALNLRLVFEFLGTYLSFLEDGNLLEVTARFRDPLK